MASNRVKNAERAVIPILHELAAIGLSPVQIEKLKELINAVYREPFCRRLPSKVWAELCAIIYRRDGYICAYCADIEGPFHIDHIEPLTRSGTNDPDNLCVACRTCNLSKGDLFVKEWQG